MTTSTAPKLTKRDHALNDLFTTALEGGIGYWSECSRYQWSDGEGNPIREFQAVIHDTVDEAEDGSYPRYVIDRLVIQRGMNRLYRHLIRLGDEANRYHKKACADYAYGKWDDFDYDSDTADMVVQFGLFGSIQYQ